MSDPNARPAICGHRSATLNNHGDIAPSDVLRVRDKYYSTRIYYVDREQWNGTRVRLTQFRKDGTLKGTMNARARTWTHAEPIHRDNVEVAQ